MKYLVKHFCNHEGETKYKECKDEGELCSLIQCLNADGNVEDIEVYEVRKMAVEVKVEISPALTETEINVSVGK